MTAATTALDRLATSASHSLLAWLVARVEPARADWLLAMQGELDAIDGRWTKLTWALGALPLAWSLNRHRLAPAIVRHLTGGPMNDRSQPAARPWLDTLILNAVTLAGWWLCLRLVVVQMGGLSDYKTGTLIIIAACAIGTLAALALRMRGAAYVLAGFVAMQSVEYVLHSLYGIHVVQGGEIHLSNMTAGILAVTWGAYIARAAGATNAALWNPKDMLDSALRIGVAMRRKLGIAAIVPVAVIIFAVTEVVARVVFRLHPFHDGLSNWAILLCAIVGALLGLAVGGVGERLTHRRTRLTPERIGT